jgi:FkbM family methyltransferase
MMTQGEGGLDELVRDRFFPGFGHGLFVDVGAARPDFLSMSALYRRLGWRIIAIEPNPIFCDAHRAAGYEVLEYACSDHDEDCVDFELVDSHGAPYEGGAVSFESFSALRVKDSYRTIRADLDLRTIKVKVRRLDSILAAHAPDVQGIDILAVDVEGWELEVLDGLTFDRYQPKLLIVENLFTDPSYREAMRARGYRLWRRVGPNDVYVPGTRLARAAAWPVRAKTRALSFLRLRRALARSALRVRE